MADNNYCNEGCPACDIRRVLDGYMEAGVDADTMLMVMLEVINETFCIEAEHKIQVH